MPERREELFEEDDVNTIFLCTCDAEKLRGAVILTETRNSECGTVDQLVHI